MNIITPEMPVDGNDMHSVASAIDSIAQDLCRRILMIETGKRHWVDGARVNDPAPYFTRQTEFCTINEYRKNADIVILLPGDTTSNVNAIKTIFARINQMLSDVEREINPPGTADTRFEFGNGNFVSAQSEFIRKPVGLILPGDDAADIEKRMFIYETKTKKKAAFKWRIYTDFRERESKCGRTFDYWLVDRSTIILNLARHDLSALTSCELLISVERIAGLFGVRKLVEYTVRNDYSCVNPARWLELKRSSVEQKLTNNGQTEPAPLVKDSTLSVLETRILPKPAPVHCNRLYCVDHASEMPSETCSGPIVRVVIGSNKALLGAKFIELSPNAPKDSAEFYALFLECKNNVVAPRDVCQLCKQDVWKTGYAIRAGDPAVNSRMYAIVCEDCLLSQPTFPELSLLHPIYAFNATKTFIDVAESRYGIPTRHALLINGSIQQMVRMEGNMLVARTLKYEPRACTIKQFLELSDWIKRTDPRAIEFVVLDC